MEEDKYKTLESLREARKFLNDLEGCETEVELDTLAAIALLRRPELAKRCEKALGDKFIYMSFGEFVYKLINLNYGSALIVKKEMGIEAIIRCAEAHNKGMASEEIYKKYIGIEGSEDSLDNLYFNKRLDVYQKQYVALNYDNMFGDAIFSTMVGEDFSRSIHQDERKKGK